MLLGQLDAYRIPIAFDVPQNAHLRDRETREPRALSAWNRPDSEHLRCSHLVIEVRFAQRRHPDDELLTAMRDAGHLERHVAISRVFDHLQVESRLRLVERQDAGLLDGGDDPAR